MPRRGLLVIALLAGPVAGGLHGADAGAFYTQRGTDPTFQEVLDSGDLPRGRNSTTGVEGSAVRVEDHLLKTGPNAGRRIPQDIRIHTLGNSFVRRNDFANWSRWYQEDGNTQVFRLFEGEENVRNSRTLAARVEAYSTLKWQRGQWHEWVGTYTIIKPHGAAIFQAKNNDNDWSVQLNMGGNGDIRLNHRRGRDKIIARNMVGKPFHIRVRDNGHDYEVYLNGVKQGAGSYARPTGATSFRWGMYLGASELKHDAMILVTGAGINPRNYRPELAMPDPGAPSGPAPKSEPGREPDPLAAPGGLPVPERLWTDAGGRTVRAPGVYEVGSDYVNLKIDDQWIEYPLEKLSADDRQALLQAANFLEE